MNQDRHGAATSRTATYAFAAWMFGPRSLLSLETVLMSVLAERTGSMPGPGELSSQQRARIIGREWVARLRGLVDPVPQASQVLVVTGEAGMGKTVLLADAAGRARSAGMRILSVTGRESESKLAFAGLNRSRCGRCWPARPGFPAWRPRRCWGALGPGGYLSPNCC